MPLCSGGIMTREDPPGDPAYTCVRRVFLFFILVTLIIFTEQTNKYEQARTKTKISQYESRSS